MSDDMDAMMADGLLHTVRECARRLYKENQTYPCDDVKRMAAENEKLRAALEPFAQMGKVMMGRRHHAEAVVQYSLAPTIKVHHLVAAYNALKETSDE